MKDKVSGITGIATSRIDYLYGCSQYGIIPPAVDSKMPESVWLDEGRVEVIGEGISPASVTADVPGAENQAHPQDGRRA